MFYKYSSAFDLKRKHVIFVDQHYCVVLCVNRTCDIGFVCSVVRSKVAVFEYNFDSSNIVNYGKPSVGHEFYKTN